MKSAQPFDRQHIACCNQFDCFIYRIVTGNDFSFRIPQFQLRAANRTGIGFGMKTAIGRILVFRAALRTKGKAIHGGMNTVIRDIIDNR
jgi:hypothetical protein